MALPAEFNTIQVYGKYLNLDGTPVVGYLTFEAAPVILKAAVSKDLIVPVVLQVNLADDGSFSIYLPVTDDPDINPHDWTYKVTEGFGTRRVYNIEVHLALSPSINIYDLAPVAISTGEYYLQGATGPAGPPARITTGKPDNAIGGDGDYAIDLATGIIYHNVSGVWDNGSHLAAADIAAHAALTRTHGIQAGSALVGTTDTQTLSNKTLAAPTVTGGLTANSSHITGNETVDGTLSVAGAATLPAITGPTTLTGNETITGQLTVQGSTQLAAVTLTGNLDLGTHDANLHNLTATNLITTPRVTISGTPSATTDAATKGYVDATAGDTVANPSTLVRRDSSSNVAVNQLNIGAGAPTANGHAARKDYVDGKFRPTINAQTGNYTLVVSDEGKLVQVNSATGVQVTVPTNATAAFPIGSVVQVEQFGAGGITFVPAAGVTINSINGNLVLAAQYSVVELLKTGTDTWVLAGSLDGSTAATVAAATSANTANALMKRDSSGNVNVNQLIAAASIQAGGSFMQTQLGSDPAVPGAGQMKMYPRTDEGLYLLGPTSGKRRASMHWGDVTAFPSTAVLQGDTCRRTNLGNTIWTYDGANWQTTYGAVRGKMWRNDAFGGTLTTSTTYTIPCRGSRLAGGFTWGGGDNLAGANSYLSLPLDGFYDIVAAVYVTGGAAAEYAVTVSRGRTSVATANILNGFNYKASASTDDQFSVSSPAIPLKAADTLFLNVCIYTNSGGTLAYYGITEVQGCILTATYAGPLNGTTAF